MLPQSQEHNLENSIQNILNIYNHKDVVLVSESHGNKETHDFLKSLLSNPKCIEVIDDIIVEFGNPLYQNIMDQYISGKKVSRDSLALAWKNTTMLFTWDSPLYKEFFKTVRDINLKTDKKKYRVLLGDPPIDWNKVNSKEDYEKYVSKRDMHFYEVIKNESIKRDRKALVIVGGGHIVPLNLATGKPETRPLRTSIGQLLQTYYPNTSFGLWTITGVDEVWEECGFNNPYTLLFSNHSLLKGRSFRPFYGSDLYIQVEIDGEKVWRPKGDDKWVKTETAIDGILYLNKSNTTINADRNIYQGKYLKQIKRRSKIIDAFFGFTMHQDRIARILGN